MRRTVRRTRSLRATGFEDGDAADMTHGELQLTRKICDAAYKLYNAPEGDKKHLALPYFATVEQLKGLPRTVVLVNECDPLKDEGQLLLTFPQDSLVAGVALYRKLLAAGVPARLIISGGTTHGSEILIKVVPEIAEETAKSIAAFAASL